ncbi:hypothetical protein U8335_04015 [Roseiconus lacunae]|uniref:hypothetical protein n=1 Tax=Roseiconus lacunae TaxID=2605694 RepID=UPI003086A90D|nr:hypothetical protein U8335_04015 [Stieleria sp. HD01]
MSTPEELNEAIEANATAPASASNSTESASQHSLKDQIAVANRAERRALNAGRGKGRTVRFSKVIPPGAL